MSGDTLTKQSTTDTTLCSMGAALPRRSPRALRTKTRARARSISMSGRVTLTQTCIVPKQTSVQRSVSCSLVEAQRQSRQRAMYSDIHCVKLQCQDDAMCDRSRVNLLRLIETVRQSPGDSTSTSVILAKKALKYRHLLGCVEQADLTDLTVDTAQVLHNKRGQATLVSARRPLPTIEPYY